MSPACMKPYQLCHSLLLEMWLAVVYLNSGRCPALQRQVAIIRRVDRPSYSTAELSYYSGMNCTPWIFAFPISMRLHWHKRLTI